MKGNTNSMNSIAQSRHNGYVPGDVPPLNEPMNSPTREEIDGLSIGDFVRLFAAAKAIDALGLAHPPRIEMVFGRTPQCIHRVMAIAPHRVWSRPGVKLDMNPLKEAR